MAHSKPLPGGAVKEQPRTMELRADPVVARLLEAEAKYRGIFESAQEGIFQTTPDGRYLSANPALAKMLGYGSPEELISSVTDLGRQLCVRPESRDEFRRRLEADGHV